ncbi:hypothetical protein B0H11DRAFT_204022 [Mycena galericulata]|nr:hypothetical protein B0H11DRAFT_204022 [Mycena galericulata]
MPWSTSRPARRRLLPHPVTLHPGCGPSMYDTRRLDSGRDSLRTSPGTTTVTSSSASSASVLPDGLLSFLTARVDSITTGDCPCEYRDSRALAPTAPRFPRRLGGRGDYAALSLVRSLAHSCPSRSTERGQNAGGTKYIPFSSYVAARLFPARTRRLDSGCCPGRGAGFVTGACVAEALSLSLPFFQGSRLGSRSILPAVLPRSRLLDVVRRLRVDTFPSRCADSRVSRRAVDPNTSHQALGASARLRNANVYLPSVVHGARRTVVDEDTRGGGSQAPTAHESPPGIQGCPETDADVAADDAAGVSLSAARAGTHSTP